jgi:hypothetical protein
MDFKWEIQERIDRGMNPDEAYNATRDSYASFYDNREKFACDCNARCVCTCTSEVDCECKIPVEE